ATKAGASRNRNFAERQHFVHVSLLGGIDPARIVVNSGTAGAADDISRLAEGTRTKICENHRTVKLAAVQGANFLNRSRYHNHNSIPAGIARVRQIPTHNQKSISVCEAGEREISIYVNGHRVR